MVVGLSGAAKLLDTLDRSLLTGTLPNARPRLAALLKRQDPPAVIFRMRRIRRHQSMLALCVAQVRALPRHVSRAHRTVVAQYHQREQRVFDRLRARVT